MSQERFVYDYTNLDDAIRNAKRHCLSHEFSTCIVQNPKTAKFIILMCTTPADIPTRVPVLWRQDPLPPPLPIEHETGDMMNALYEMIRDGVVCLHIVNKGFNVHEDSLDALCAEWIEDGSINPENWEED